MSLSHQLKLLFGKFKSQRGGLGPEHLCCSAGLVLPACLAGHLNLTASQTPSSLPGFSQKTQSWPWRTPRLVAPPASFGREGLQETSISDSGITDHYSSPSPTSSSHQSLIFNIIALAWEGKRIPFKPAWVPRPTQRAFSLHVPHAPQRAPFISPSSYSVI